MVGDKYLKKMQPTSEEYNYSKATLSPFSDC